MAVGASMFSLYYARQSKHNVLYAQYALKNYEEPFCKNHHGQNQARAYDHETVISIHEYYHVLNVCSIDSMTGITTAHDLDITATNTETSTSSSTSGQSISACI